MNAKNLETKNILIDEKNYKDLTIYFARYDYGKTAKMLNLYYHQTHVLFYINSQFDKSLTMKMV